MTQSSSGGNRGNRQRPGGRNRNRNSSGNRGGGGKRRSSQPNRRQRKPEPKPTAWQKFVKWVTFGAVDLTPSAKRKKTKSSKSGKPKKKREPLKVEPTSGRLYVGNLDYGVEDSDLSAVFSKAGSVVSASVVRHGGSDRSKGFAFVEMSSVEEAKKAVDTLNDLDLKGRKMLVSGAKSEKPEQEKKPRREKPEQKRDKRSSSRKERRGGKGAKSGGETDSRKVKVREIETVSSPAVLVSGLNGEAEEVDISDLFDQIGAIQSRDFVDGQEGAPTKQMRIVFAETSQAQKAVEFLDGKSFMGHRLKITGVLVEKEDSTPDTPVAGGEEGTPSADS